MAQIRGSRTYLLEARGKLMDGKARLTVDINQAVRELAEIGTQISAIDELLDALDADTPMDAR